jgi:hypothetical protein
MKSEKGVRTVPTQRLGVHTPVVFPSFCDRSAPETELRSFHFIPSVLKEKNSQCGTLMLATLSSKIVP